MQRWFVVSNMEGTILAVYGSALCDEAYAKARNIERDTGCATWVHDVLCDRPHVGQSISMKGTPSQYAERG